MNKKKILVIFFVLLSLASIVYAAEDDNFINAIFEPFYGVNVGETYDEHSTFIDAVLYFFIFVGAAQFTLRKKFEGRGGKAVIGAIGVALAFSMSYWANKVGFSLKDFGPVAAGILVALFAIMIFKLAGGAEGKMRAVAFAVLAVYIAVQVVMPQLLEALSELGKWGKFAVGFLNLMVIIAIALLPIELSRFWRGRLPGGGDVGTERGYEREAAERDRAERTGRGISREEQVARRLSNIDADLLNRDERLHDLINRDERDELQRLRRLGELINELAAVSRRIEAAERGR